MQIVNYSEKYLDSMIDLFINFHKEDSGDIWTYENAKEHLINLGIKDYEKFSYFLVDDEDNVIAGVLAGEFPVWDGKIIQINFIAVKKEFREKGLAKKLLMHLVSNIKKQDYYGMALEADKTKEFPRKWYESMGFEQIDWVDYFVEFNELNIK